MKITRLKLSFFAFLFPALAWSAISSLNGKWEGEVTIPSADLNVMLSFEENDDGVIKGTIDIPQQNVKNFQLVDISVTGNRASFRIDNIPGEPTFKGELDKDGQTIKGRLHQGGQTFPFELRRGSKAEFVRKALAGLDTSIEKALSDFNTPGLALGVVAGGEVALAKGYGFRDVEKKLPVTENTLFAIGSTTKAFTAALIGTLFDEGKLAWDDRVIQHLQDFRLKDAYAQSHMTVRDLLCHRSGLPRHDLVWYNSPLSREALYHSLAELEPTYDLRQQYQYQNLMYLTAGVLAERLLDQPWEASVRERLLDPLGMQASRFRLDEVKASPDYALPYFEKEDDDLLEVPFRNIENIGPAGSIFSNIVDMNKWVAFQLNEGMVGDETLLQQTTLREMHSPQTIMGGYPANADAMFASYGLGWILDAYYGHFRVTHDGAIDGFTATVSLLPHEDIGVVVLVNKSGAALGGVVLAAIFDRLLDIEGEERFSQGLAAVKRVEEVGDKSKQEQAKQRIPDTQPSHPLEDYVAKYRCPGYYPVEITLEDGHLVMNFNEIRTVLDHFHYDVFKSSAEQEHPVFAEQKIQFTQNADGQVDAVEIKLEALLEPLVFKREADRKFFDPAYLEKFLGRFELPPQKIRFELAGDHLVLHITGQPAYQLEATLENEFSLKDMPGFKVVFRKEVDGRMTEATFNQPNGSFTAKRVD